ncbi:MAG: prepilin-type N-terminal cleavage/methylation domain-containing protein [Polyangiaceae bacterium]|nr:prepilin-type N-terminal cleavage/methylation domain-containing protein [Polyangiaceae bacterium]
MTRARRRGFTVVELMIALTVFAIGVSGIIATQKVTVAANQHAKNLAIATSIAQAWQDQLAVDATYWTPDGTTQPDWLTSNNGAWFRPEYKGARNFGAAFDALGNVVDDTADPNAAQFCTHLRLTLLYPQTGGNGLMRTEVRVFWRRDGGSGVNPVCGTGNNVPAIGADIDDYHFVYQTSAVKQSP